MKPEITLGFTLKLYGWRMVSIVFSALSYLVGLLNPAKRGYIPTTGNPLLLESATNLSRKIRRGQIKSRDVVEAYVQRIKEVQPLLNAVIDERFEDALKEASQIDADVERRLASNMIPTLDEKDAEAEDKPLLGLPFTCKDSIAVKGMLISAGCVARKGLRAQEDASVITALRRAGAIPIALTNVPEILLWFDSNNKLYGRTNNPYDLSRIAGGSSGGECALVSAAASLFGVCSDLGGSIRLPAHICGIFGHKPTPGVICMKGMWPAMPKGFEHYAVFGPAARYVCDLKLMFKAMVTKEKLPKLRLDEPVDLKTIKIYYMQNDGGNPLTSPLDPEIKEAMDRALGHFKEAHGVQIEQVSFRKMVFALPMWSSCLKHEDPRNVSEVMACGTGTPINILWEMFKSIFGKSIHSFNILYMALTEDILGIKRGSVESDRYREMAISLRAQMNKTLGTNGVFFYPTLPEVAPKHNTTVFKAANCGYSCVVNVLGFPSTQVAMGRLNKEGLPVGFQVISRPHNDRLTLAVAQELESTFGGWVPPFPTENQR